MRKAALMKMMYRAPRKASILIYLNCARRKKCAPLSIGLELMRAQAPVPPLSTLVRVYEASITVVSSAGGPAGGGGGGARKRQDTASQAAPVFSDHCQVLAATEANTSSRIRAPRAHAQWGGPSADHRCLNPKP